MAAIIFRHCRANFLPGVEEGWGGKQNRLFLRSKYYLVGTQVAASSKREEFTLRVASEEQFY
jgi:hypothetical protein